MTLKRWHKENLSVVLFCLPALLFYIIFLVIPMIGGIIYSLTDWNGLSRQYDFVGIKNYIEAFSGDKYFMQATVFTLKYVVVMVILENVFAMLLAVMIESKVRLKSLLRTVFFAPNMISLIIGSLMWTFIFSKVLPSVAENTFLKFLDQSWIGNTNLSFYCIIAVSLWAGVGYYMVIYMAALQGVPKEIKEAALIDGVNPLQNFLHITLPLIYHAVTICSFLTLNASIKVFDVVYGLTRGGPGRATETFTFNIFSEAFAQNLRYGYASAKAIILFVIVLIIALVQVIVMKRKEVEL